MCPVEISHLKVDAPSKWGASAKALSMIDAARAKGMKVEADVYLYDAASSTLGIRFPAWALEGGQEKINARLDDAAEWTRIKEEMKKLIPHDRMVSDTRRVVFYYRLSPDQRSMVFGGRVAYMETNPLVSVPRSNTGSVPSLVKVKLLEPVPIRVPVGPCPSHTTAR